MIVNIDQVPIKIVQDIDRAISVMHNAATWLAESGKHPSKWWLPKNMNRDFLLQHAEPDEFYVALVGEKPAASVILQDNERNQSWNSVDKGKPPRALYVHWLCVGRNFAGTGLSKTVIDFAEKYAQRKNISVLRLDTNVDEVKLRALYEHLGFRLMGIEQEDCQKTAFYQKEL